MPSTIETTVFKFDELNESAKENARDWYKGCIETSEWSEYVYDDVKECGALIGITVDNIYFTGFSSQGDGACFEGSYRYKKGAIDAVSAHTGGMNTLVNLAKELQEIQRKAFYRLSAKVKHSGRYYHENCTDIDVYKETNDAYVNYADADTDEKISECLKSFMRWIYRELERAHDDYMSDVNIDETIRINEYTFTEDGKRFG